jgi:helicase MOV-10
MGVILGESRYITVSVLLTSICHNSFKATFKGRSQSIRPGTENTVQIEFIPEFEGRFEATLQLIFASTQQSKRFAVSRGLQAVAGSVKDLEPFEPPKQNRYLPSSGSGEQIPPEKIIPLQSLAQQFGDLPEYKLPAKVQEAVNSVTPKNRYEDLALSLIKELRPKKLAMDTYAQFFTALLNVEEGHQQ